MDKIIIFGASKLGETALHYYSEDNVECFVDNSIEKIGTFYCGKRVIGINELKEKYYDENKYRIVIASLYKNEISQQLWNNGFKKFVEFLVTVNEKPKYEVKLRNKELKLGNLLDEFSGNISLKNCCFVGWGSHILDYALIRTIVNKYKLKKYLEIGAFIGESVENIYDLCDEIYSISLPDESIELIDFFDSKNINNFSGYFLKNKLKVKRIFGNSLNMNFDELDCKPEIAFIDGLHTYDGIYSDTKNIMKIINMSENFIIWHDMKNVFWEYNNEFLSAVHDAIGEKYINNIFCFDTSMCGIYVPDKYIKDFRKYEKVSNNTMYSYDININVNKNVL